VVETEVKKEFKKELEDLQKKRFAEDNYYNEVAQYIDSREKAWQKLLTTVQRRIITEFGRESFDVIEAGKPMEQKMELKKFNAFVENVELYITDIVGDHVTKINDTTKTKLRNIIQRGFAEGLPVKGEDSIESLIESLYLEQIIPNRSQTIARTEVVGASNFGSWEGARQSTPDLLKIWIVTPDGRERESHGLMENHPAIGMNEQFAIFNPEEGGTSYAEFPGDPSLPAYEVINCRCAIGYEYQE
jgi:hypothetical protein